MTGGSPWGRGLVLAVACGYVLGATPQDSRGTVPTIVFESPTDHGYVSGATTLRVRVESAGLAVTSVSLFADGSLVCSHEHPPFECAWQAGPRVSEHVLRAVAVLTNGQRLARSIRTRGVDVVERVDVDAVQITATVTGGPGQFIRGLVKDQFVITEDGVPQTISSFSAEDTPLELVVAIDFSGSMTTAMPTVRAALHQFLASLRPTDRVTVLAFNHEVFTLSTPTTSRVARHQAVDRLQPWGGTALHDVIVRALRELGTQAGRHAIVLFSDGEDRDSRAPLRAVEQLIESSDAVLYAIGQGRAADQLPLRRVLSRLAERSGGRAFFEDLNGLEHVFRDIVADLSNQYLLGYSPLVSTHDARWREIDVRVPGTSYQVRARRGYRLPAG